MVSSLLLVPALAIGATKENMSAADNQIVEPLYRFPSSKESSVSKTSLIEKSSPDSKAPDFVATSSIQGELRQTTFRDAFAPRRYLIELTEPPLTLYQSALQKEADVLTADKAKVAKASIKSKVRQHKSIIDKQHSSVTNQLRQKQLVAEVSGQHHALLNMLVVSSSPDKIAQIQKLHQVKRIVEEGTFSKTLTKSVGIVRATET
jgi:hypothetical protein